MNKLLPLVSVMMPAYNVQNYIGAAIESILNQTYKNIEIIIINDGSTDGTVDVIRAYSQKNERIKFIDRKENKGIAFTRNECISHCKGDYIACMDSDDIALSTRLEVQISIMLKNPNIDICGTWMKLFGTDTGLWKNPKENEQIKYGKILFGKIGVNHPTAIFKSKIFKDYKYRTNFVGEDYDLFAMILLCKDLKFYNVQKMLYRYRRFPYQHTAVRVEELHKSVLKSTSIVMREIFPEVSAEYIRIYQTIITKQPIFRTKKEVKLVYYFLKKLKCKLEEIEQKTLPYFLSDAWFETCLSQQKYGMKVFWIYLSSPLIRGGERFWQKITKIFMRCIRNRLKI